ncbi:putative MFS family arabinose efflux permease [Serratia fonticola]|uniref:Putative MFS family arabinose efflux permease n=1 Tax=Serratia fonticola TaxID=47917 RepID=A0A559T1A0_SERFO|nr:MFS transporter [Serratia fonticola]TQI79131.1 putative MFS family arabinose efflux permease [Serratia fonticola]TQI98845.1 putative MFS family arabinose efflux permease [Serratia fonticola]TVZ68371.1 putative MFS family arabinose efflux permease [Serratia fonticola]
MKECEPPQNNGRSVALLFPLSLMLFEFAAYLTNDMIQPGIINVVREFSADVSLAPASISVYMAGGMVLQWLLGPLSDRIGRRPVLLTGALLFVSGCLATLFTNSMEQYLLTRFIQGTSMCFIATVGYVAVQEAFGEKDAIKMMALITSITLIAPIIGPLAGAAFIQIAHWKGMFALIAVIALIAALGLWRTMPETVTAQRAAFSLGGIAHDFKQVFASRCFLAGALTISCAYIPMMAWVATSPVILIDDGGLTSSQYAWTQVPIFVAVILGNLMVVKLVGDNPSDRILWAGVPIQLVGLSMAIVGNLLVPHVWLWSVAGLSVYAFGTGMIFPILFRRTLFSSSAPKGTVSATLNIIVLSSVALSIELGRAIYQYGNKELFHAMGLAAGVLSLICLVHFLKQLKVNAEIKPESPLLENIQK